MKRLMSIAFLALGGLCLNVELAMASPPHQPSRPSPLVCGPSNRALLNELQSHKPAPVTCTLTRSGLPPNVSMKIVYIVRVNGVLERPVQHRVTIGADGTLSDSVTFMVTSAPSSPLGTFAYEVDASGTST